MIFFRRVVGGSMMPTLRHGQSVVFVSRRDYKIGEVVCAVVDSREVVKRIVRCDGQRVYLCGDNTGHSTDSRHYGAIDKGAILGSMKYSIPVSQDPPKLRHPRGAVLGWGAAGVMVLFAVVHLIRIDTFVPELSHVLGGNRTVTLWLASGIVVSEVFAIPFLMRMRLSLLAQYVSGALGVVVPLFWTLVAVWSYGLSASTAQLGEFVSLPSSWLLIVGDLVWLGYAYFTLWALGYDYRPHERQSFVTKWFARLSK